MFRKLFLALAVIALALLPGTAAAAKSYSADRFDVDITIRGDGALLITETVVFRFVGGPFTFVFRELETDNTDGATDIEASMDGVPLPPGKGAGQVEVKGRDPVKVTWHFAPVSDAAHTFVLKYRLLGAIRQEQDADALFHNALPTDYDYRIASSTVRITWPGDVNLIAPAEVRRGSAEIATGNRQVTFVARDLRSDSPLLVSLRFPRGSLIDAPPAWQTRQAETNASLPLYIGLTVAVTLLGGVALFFFYLRADRRAVPVTSTGFLRPTAPPGDFPPALASALTQSGASPGWPGALATLLDLGRRGVITIEESPERKWYRQRDFIIRLQSRPSGLRPHEEGLLALLFQTKKGPRASVKVSELSGSLSSGLKKFSEPLKEEMRRAGLLSAERQRVKNQLVVMGVLLLVFGFVGMMALALIGAGLAVLASLGLDFVGAAALIASATFSPLSDEGAQEAARWQGFKLYLQEVLRGRAAMSATLLEQYLPYAAGFGLAEKWAKLFSKQSGAEIPAWFHSLAATNAEGMAAFVAVMAATSSAGSSAGGAGAAGASGGGSSGAG
ncbi:MAG: DUF2207 domain-containing protein [Anaerolineae bacterium]|nr:DUF2207 domain-containing protein [Anaerolineae bacterium]